MKNPLKKIIRLPYYYVPPCPVCGSYITGHFMKSHRKTDYEWQIDESLSNGEIVDFKSNVGNINAFCVSCGYEWSEIIELKFFTLERIEEEKERRGTSVLLTQRRRESGEARMLAKKKTPVYLKPLTSIRDFIGKV